MEKSDGRLASQQPCIPFTSTWQYLVEARKINGPDEGAIEVSDGKMEGVV